MSQVESALRKLKPRGIRWLVLCLIIFYFVTTDTLLAVNGLRLVGADTSKEWSWHLRISFYRSGSQTSFFITTPWAACEKRSFIGFPQGFGFSGCGGGIYILTSMFHVTIMRWHTDLWLNAGLLNHTHQSYSLSYCSILLRGKFGGIYHVEIFLSVSELLQVGFLQLQTIEINSGCLKQERNLLKGIE